MHVHSSAAPPLLAADGEKEEIMSRELLIKGGHVVTVDPDLGDLPAGDVLVADGIITAVGPDLEPTTTAAEVIDAAGRLVIPGMVDTHRHVWQGAIGGLPAPDHRGGVRARRADRHLAEALPRRRVRRHDVGRPAGPRRGHHHWRRLGAQRPVPSAWP